MKPVYKFFLITLLMAWSPSFAQESFVSGFEDLPLMEGLETQDEELYFDTPSGRIVESHAYSSELTAKKVLDFYAATLPQLGWTVSGKNSYFREGETLTIETSVKNAKLDVKFFLQPKK